MMMWAAFIFLVLLLLALDLGIFHKNSHEIHLKESLLLSSFYFFISIFFGLWIGWIRGLDAFAEYMTGFLIEKSLSLDNIFVISLVFSSLSIPKKYEHRVLFWGILGAIFFRGVMIGLGEKIISQFEWVLYIFSGFMIFTGIKIIFIPHQSSDLSQNPFLLWMRKYLPVTDQFHSHRFYVTQLDKKSQRKRLFFTPLFVSLMMIEFIDLVFAIDSIPAIFSITRDPYIVYTSNIFAILGLRSLYFALSSMMNQFDHLKYALSAILIFIGSKIFIVHLLDIQKIPPLLSLLITLSLLGGGIVSSMLKNKRGKRKYIG